MKNPIMILLTLCTAATGSILTLNTTDTKPEFLPEPITNKDFYQDGAPSTEKVELGRMLFFDKVLSGNRNISCGTCHSQGNCMRHCPVGLSPTRSIAGLKRLSLRAMVGLE